MTKNFRYFATPFALFLILMIGACNDNRLKVDVSDIDVKLNIQHFEHDLFENKINDYNTAKQQYGYFTDDYTMGILGFRGDSLTAFNQLLLYRQDQNAKKMYGFVKEKYGNFKPYEDELTKAYKYFKYYFPEEPIPAIITYTGNFSFYLNPVGQGYIGIALDMHMGSDFKPYEYANIEQYWRKILTPQTIVPNHMMAHANDLFAATNKGETFADHMVYYGKLLYFLDATTPDVADEVKIGMTKAEFEWCKKEEKSIWAFIVKEKLLYETESKRYDKLLNEGPKTVMSGVPPDAPAMLGRYVGWMLIRQLMSENKDITLPELMKNGNAKSIIQESGYKPE